ncbi:hypothetical protein [Allobaculum stercoricanis]|uniref:hypothetical protein n=1 Tax=Allobaculum stercoricanis TaxID=174709 RepID=UPI002942E709|nr:hypothetical protein [Allobaculum stercoricanis]
MNKKFFAALASATMAFTASGSIAVFADDFVEEKTPVVDGNVVKPEETVKWNKENFGDLATKKDEVNPNVTINTLTVTNGEVKVKDLENVTTITLGADFKGEVKGLEYFTKLTSFTAEAGTLENKTLDFSANKVLATLSVTNAADLTGVVLPEPFIDTEDGDKEVYSLATLTLENTALTSLDLSAQDTLGTVTVTDNKNLKEVTVQHGTKKTPREYATLDFSANNLETVNLDNVAITTKLNLSNNHIGVLDLSKTTVDGSNVDLKGQKFYISEKFGTVTLTEIFENFDVEKVTDTTGFNKETGVLTLDDNGATYKYKTGVAPLEVTLEKANPMNRLYNPNSGEHFYTADNAEKEALVNLGWNDEGYGWVAPKKADGVKDVYRLYNPNAGDHHYTMNKGERDTLVTYGWKDEGTGWKSAANTATPVYRQYNPYANGAGAHNYTTDKAENDHLVSLGWTPEGKAWFALQ